MIQTLIQGNRLPRLLLFMLTCVGTACSHTAPAMELIYQSGQCGDLEPGLHRLTEQSELDRVVERRRILSLDGEVAATPQANFQSLNVLLITEGQRTTAGYSLRLEDSSVEVLGDRVILPVEFISPEGGFVAQVMTSPCLVVGLEKGEYRQIQSGPYTLNLD